MVGNSVKATDSGAAFTMKYKLVENLVKIAESGAVFTMKCKAVEDWVKVADSGAVFTMKCKAIEDWVKVADLGAVFTIKNTRDFSSMQGRLFGASCSLLQTSGHWASLSSFIKIYFKPNVYIETRLSSLNLLA